jgi:thioredoxin 1
MCHVTPHTGHFDRALVRPSGTGHAVLSEETAMAREFTSANFKTAVLGSDKPVLVDFWAPWCGPCQMIAPLIDKLADDLSASHVIGKVNVDEHPILADAFEVGSIPTLVLFKDGQPVKRISGFRSEPQLREFLRDHAIA